MPSLKTLRLRILSGVLAVSSTLASAQPTASLAEQARELLASGHTTQALTTARRAVEQQPNDYKNHYYLAYALMETGETAAAQRAAARALALAGTGSAKAAVQALIASIGARDGLAEADAALADGLHTKAARLYQAIWKRGGLPADKTMAVVELLLRQGNDMPGAIAILRDATTRHLGTPTADTAAKRLNELQPELRKLAVDAVQQASALDPQDPERARWLRSALEADADHLDARLMQANDAAETRDWPALQAQLRQLQRSAKLEGLMTERKLALGRWQEHAELRGLLSDIWGESRALELLRANSAEIGPISPQRAQAARRAALGPAQQQLLQSGVVPGQGAAFRDCEVCPDMVWVPPGKLPHRDETNNKVNAWLNRLQFEAPFAVGKYEVTFAQWDACAVEGGCRGDVPEGRTVGTFFDTEWGRGQQPVIRVSLNDARAYARWVSSKTGHHYRVLSRAEYMYVAQAGLAVATHAHIGNCIGCSAPHENQTVPVGSFAANPWGLHDLTGNVHELIEGCDGDSAQAEHWPTDGAPFTTHCLKSELAAERGIRIALQGASWAMERPSSPHTFGLYYTQENRRLMDVGFRLTRSLLPP